MWGGRGRGSLCGQGRVPVDTVWGEGPDGRTVVFVVFFIVRVQYFPLVPGTTSLLSEFLFCTVHGVLLEKGFHCRSSRPVAGGSPLIVHSFPSRRVAPLLSHRGAGVPYRKRRVGHSPFWVVSHYLCHTAEWNHWSVLQSSLSRSTSGSDRKSILTEVLSQSTWCFVNTWLSRSHKLRFYFVVPYFKGDRQYCSNRQVTKFNT